jgi:hypothetical protein
LAEAYQLDFSKDDLLTLFNKRQTVLLRREAGANKDGEKS